MSIIVDTQPDPWLALHARAVAIEIAIKAGMDEPYDCATELANFMLTGRSPEAEMRHQRAMREMRERFLEHVNDQPVVIQ